MEPFIGQIMMFGFNFNPRGWAFCNGQLLPIVQYQALFSLLGTMYGGDGRSTFGLPDLRGRVPISFGQGSGLPNYPIGQRSGAESVTLNTNNLPSHNHDVVIGVTEEDGNTNEANGNILAKAANNNFSTGSPTSGQELDGVTTSNTGNSQTFSNMQPYLAINFCIALTGIFPSRN